MKCNFYIKALLFIIILQSIQIVPAFAQKGSSKMERLILDKALTAIEDYETLSAVSDEEAYYSFLELFNDEDLLIYNDLLGSSSQRLISVKDYADFQIKEAKRKQVFCTNIKRERFWEEDGVWKVEYSFEKVSSYSNNCGVFFSSKEFYGNTYNMKMLLSYSEDANKCIIESLTGEIISSQILDSDFYTFQKTSNYDNSLNYKGKALTFNSYGQAFLKGNLDNNDFTSFDPDFLPMPQVDSECRIVTMKYKSRRMMVKAHYDMAIGEVLSLGKSSSLVETKTSSNSFGVDFGYYFPSKTTYKAGLFVGIGMTKSKIDMSYNTDDYSLSTNQDIDGDDYVRHYTNLSMTQDIQMTDINIPIYLDLNFRFGRYLSLYLDLGARVNLNISNNMEADAKVDYVYGIYPKYDNLKLDGNWGFNGFGRVQLNSSSQSDNEVSDIAKFSADALGGIGFRFYIPQTTIAIDLGARYIYGIMDAVKASSDPLSLSGTGTQSNALIYNTMQGSTSTEHVRSLTAAVDGIKNRGLFVSVGLAYKF